MNEDEHTQEIPWREKEVQYARLCEEVGQYADEMVALLTAHGEQNWTAVFARFSKSVRTAKNDKQRRAAIADMRSIYGGMGSWNDFYIQALGEAESLRSSLSYAVSRKCDELEALIDTPPLEPRTSLSDLLLSFFGLRK